MFGQKDDQSQQQPDSSDVQNPMMQNNTPPADFFNPTTPAPQQPAAMDNQMSQPTSSPMPPADMGGAPMIMDDNPADFTAPATPDDVAAESAPASYDRPADISSPSAPADDSSTSAPVSNDQLLSMKQEALQQLNPLVNHLDQSPEEKFRTVMMMIQAADDHTKLNEAFETAKQITDDKARAQALLDVINEINYFTQNHNS